MSYPAKPNDTVSIVFNINGTIIAFHFPIEVQNPIFDNSTAEYL